MAKERLTFQGVNRLVIVGDTARLLSRQLSDLPTLGLDTKQRTFLARSERNLSALADFLDRAAGTAPQASLGQAAKVAETLRNSFAQVFSEGSTSKLAFGMRVLLSVIFVYLLDLAAVTSTSTDGSSDVGRKPAPKGPMKTRRTEEASRRRR